MANSAFNATGISDFDAVRLAVASPEDILKWSYGEVLKPETINYRTQKPERDGLFCERIFGPVKDINPHDSKLKGVRSREAAVDKNGELVTKSIVRRERMGHIQLAVPVAHIWFMRGTPSAMSQLLGMTVRNIEKIVYFATYVILNVDEATRDQYLADLEAETDLARKAIKIRYEKMAEEDGADVKQLAKEQSREVEELEESYVGKRSQLESLNFGALISESEYRNLPEEYDELIEVGMGASAVKELLDKIELPKLIAELTEEVETAKGQRQKKLLKRLKMLESMESAGIKPSSLCMTVLPVIPPDLRPMVALSGGRFATSDLNDLYRRIINRNNRLKKLIELNAPEVIQRNEKRMLQEAVDALIDNSASRGRAVSSSGGRRSLKSLSDMLKGKQGRFRQNLLGKRVDYSGRSVIVVGPELKFYQCGLPKKMALELFKPFIMKELVAQGYAHNIKNAKKLVEKVKPEVWDVLEEVIKEHPVMLNRAPTLHRLGIQAFEPVLVEGKAIKLHPLVCTPFNADFDGDQMAVHVPLSVEAQAEARFLMLSVNNILAPKDGSPITAPTQDMILGAYYLTYPGTARKVEVVNGKERTVYAMDEFTDVKLSEANKAAGFERIPEKGDGKVFTDMDEMIMAYHDGVVNIHAKVKVRMFDGPEDLRGGLVESTVGRFIYNQGLPQDLGYIDRSKDPYSLEVNFLCGKKKLGEIIDKCFKVHANTGTVLMLDYIKSMGYKYSTKAAVSIGIDDMKIPDSKWEIIEAAQQEVDKYEKAYRAGLVSNSERYEQIIKIWNKTTDDVADALMDSLEPANNLNIMATSGARGSKNQIRQIGGMRGLMANATGHTVEIPIKANFREGLSVLEYFISSNGARKGLADTALRTADSGYLTRRLVDVSHNVIVRDIDCGSTEGVEVRAFVDGKEIIEPLNQRIAGRTALNDIVDPRDGRVIVKANEEISDDQSLEVVEAGIEAVTIRSAMTCNSKSGICAKCYGRNLATGEHVNIGESIGIIAAQSIGEPGTQLTMRTFHTGGVAGSDITHGLPRVEELFEARKPKGLAEICEEDGVVREIKARTDNKTEVIVRSEEEGDKTYIVPYGARLAVKVGDEVKKGGNITSGPLNPHDIMRLNGVEGVYQYLLKEVQRVYKNQGVDINDKHIEIIASQMLSKFKIEDPGDTDLLPGSMYTRLELAEANSNAEAEGKAPASGKRVLLGITKASLATNSFLSAASFQETTRVLTDAAIKGKNDKLLGLKENVIIGKLIPAGTGMKKYRNINLDYGEHQAEIDEYLSEVEAQREAERRAREEEKSVQQIRPQSDVEPIFEEIDEDESVSVNEYISNLEDIEIGEITSETDFEEQVEAPEEE